MKASESWPGKSEKEGNGDLNTPIKSPPVQLKWLYVNFFLVLHVAAIYEVKLVFQSAMWQTNLFAFFVYMLSILGITAGEHRLWCHRSYKAKLPLRIFLAFASLTAYHSEISKWASYHRIHHKCSDTDADPHNVKRGFFFSHIGWLMCHKHPEFIQLYKTIDVSDVVADPVVKFQKKFYWPLIFLCCFTLPTVIPMYVWGESFSNAFFIPTLLRYCLTLHMIFFVNSAAHMWGYKPYDVHIQPVENPFVALGSGGEGFHNYHHAFPFDYSSSEFGWKFNFTTAFIDIMAWFGQVYDRKTASTYTISVRKLKTGPHSNQNATISMKED